MTEVVNLRNARKQAERRKREADAAANRRAHGRSKAERSQTEALQTKAQRDLDGHRADRGDAK